MSEATAADYEAADKHWTCTMTIGELRDGLARAHAAGRASECEKCNRLQEELCRCNKDWNGLVARNEEKLRDLAEAEKTIQLLTDELASLRSQLSAAEARAVAAGSIVYEPDGEPRIAKPGEMYVTGNDAVVMSTAGTISPVQVIKRRVV